METTHFTCMHCGYDAPLPLFENMSGGMLKCKRCRSLVQDPKAFSAAKTYADCDSRRPVTRFSFQLNGKDTIVRVRPDYMALLVGNDGTKRWLTQANEPITNMLHGFQLYYVCLKPQISWGIQDIDEFGAYGVARLSISRDFVERLCNREGHVQGLEEQLRAMTVRRIAEHSRALVRKHNQAILRHSDGYISMLGVLDAGVSLTKIELKGYREADNHPVTLILHTEHAVREQEKPAVVGCKPAEKANLPRKDYRIENGVEEVFIRNDGRVERHKAGELIPAASLAPVAKRLRFFAKQFDFNNGWGLYNQVSSFTGFYAAHGTISFYVDSTELLSLLVVKPSSWDAFAEEFFSNVLRKELSAALQSVLESRISEKDFSPVRISQYLSTMSVDMTLLLNGESQPARKPAFRQYGLRVKSIDIDHMDFYAARR